MAGSLKDSFETDLLELIFENTDCANIGDGTGLRGSSTAGNFYVALYTVAPTDSAQGTEADYTSYARQAIARSGVGFDITTNNLSNASAVTFPECTGGTNTIVAFGICEADVEDVDDGIIWGDIDDPAGGLAVSTGITPEFAANVLDVNID